MATHRSLEHSVDGKVPRLVHFRHIAETQKLNRKVLLSALAILQISACGGGSSEPDQMTQGLWQGSADAGRSAWGVVQANGSYLLIISAPNGQHALESVEIGTFGKASDTRVLAPGAMSFSQSGFPFSSTGQGTSAGFFHTNSSWAGSTMNGSPIGYTLGYLNDGVQSSSLVQLTGTYSSWPIAASASSTSSMVVNSDGSLSGSYFSGCTYTGQITSTSQANMFDISLSFTGTCYMSSPSHVTGKVFHDANNSRIYVAAVNITTFPGSLSAMDGFMFVGSKN